MRRLIIIALCLAGALPALAAESITVGSFSAGDLSGWQEKKFQGSTAYTLVQEGGRRVLRAQAQGTASGLFKQVRIDPARTPILRWSWKVAGVHAKGDAHTKAGDDYAARVYVVFPGAWFWQTRGIAYIWANRLPAGHTVANAYSDRLVMVAVRSGAAQADRWLSEERNVYEDYRRLFGRPPPMIGAVVVMTDGDNTGGAAQAYYGDIIFSPAQRPPGQPGQKP